MADWLKDFYLMRCYGEESYRNSFNNGELLYLNTLEFYVNLENEFQRDNEGIVFQQPPHSSGHLYGFKSNMDEELLEKGVFQIVNGKKQINPDLSGEQIEAIFSECAGLILDTESCKLQIQGYLLCFYLIPKWCVQFKENEFVFNEDDDIRDDFNHFLHEYAKKQGYTQVCVYDAEKFLKIFSQFSEQKGYQLAYGPVKYEDVSELEKIESFKNGKLEDIVFKKPKRFEYQKEFRLYIAIPNETSQPYMVRPGINLREAVIKNFAYLTPEYIAYRWRKNEV